MSKHNFLMASPLFNERFIIITIDENNNPIEIVPHHHDKATYLGACICLAVAACKTPEGRAFFEAYAGKFCPQSSNSWRKHMSNEQLRDFFWSRFSPKGCIWLDDKTIKNLDLMGLHHRVDWGTDGFQFDPLLQGIHLNAQASKKSACFIRQVNQITED